MALEVRRPDAHKALRRVIDDVIGRGENALRTAEAAIAAHGEDAVTLGCLGDALQAAGDMAAAAAAYSRARALSTDAFEAWLGFGCVEQARRAYGSAASAFARAVAQEPGLLAGQFNHACALHGLGEVDRAVALWREVARAPESPLREAALARIACVIPADPSASEWSIGADRNVWLETRRLAIQPLPRASRRVSGAKLRIGYLSSFFDKANWMKPVWATINAHDRTAFDIHLVCDCAPPTADQGWHDYDQDVVHLVGGAENDTLARYVADLDLDVLVDLNGYSAQNRIDVLLRRPARAIVGWFNVYAAMGQGLYDVVVTDRSSVVAGDARDFGARLHFAPVSYLTFTVGYAVPPVATAPHTRGAPFTFGSFCSLYKISDPILSAWAAILSHAPGTRLRLKNAELGEPSNRAALEARFDRLGGDASRLDLEGPDEHIAFLSAYDRIDLALDTWPYSGGTTTMEALWQGVPVLALAGDRWAARTSRSLLHAAGLSDWVVPDLQSYVERAARVGAEDDRRRELASLRARMRGLLSDSPACRGADVSRSLESLYRDLCAIPDAARES